MRKHTNTTQLIGSRYPLSLRLRDAWYHYGESTAIVALLIAIALIGGALRRHYDPAPAYAELKPIILLATPVPPPAAQPTIAPVVIEVPTAGPQIVEPTAAPIVEPPPPPPAPAQEAAPAVAPVEQAPAPPAPQWVPDNAPVANLDNQIDATEQKVQALPEVNAHPVPPPPPVGGQLQQAQYSANNGANYSAECIDLKDRYQNGNDGLPIPPTDFRGLVNCQLRGAL